MATDDKPQRPLRISTPLEGDPLVLTKFQGVEQLTAPFCFRLEFVSTDDDVDFGKLLGAAATVEVDLPSDVSRQWKGILTQLCESGQDEEFTYYSATLEPRLALARMRTNYRIFQDQTVEEIVKEVLDGLDLSWNLSGDHAPRNYCVQYGESDLDFVNRLMEEEGIFYYFQPTDDGDQVVIYDDSSQLADVEGLDAVDFRDLDGGVRDAPSVHRWEKSQQLVPTSFAVRDTHFENAGEPFEAGEQVEKDEKVTVGTVDHAPNPTGTAYEIYAFPGGYAKRYDDVAADRASRTQVSDVPDAATAEATLQSKRVVLGAVTLAGDSDVLPFSPGGLFTLKKHFNADGKYLLTRVEHVVELGVGLNSSQQDDALHYENKFRCVPSSVEFRPAWRTPKPIVHGVQAAFVVAEGEDEQLYDMYGRVKVWFPWDRREGPTVKSSDDEADGDSSTDTAATTNESEGGGESGGEQPITASKRSCWIRVAQVWAGRRWGAHFWPRAGHEVLVAFEHGDPDRPVVVGSVYNSKNMPPFDMPEQAHVGGIKSCSVGGNPAENFNGVAFYDELDNEHLDLHSETHTVLCSEESSRDFVRGTAVRVFGTMYGDLSSGGGGGPAAPAESTDGQEKQADDSDDNDAPLVNYLGQQWEKWKGWKKVWLASRFEADISVTLGHTTGIVGGFPLGTASDLVQGGKVGLVLDPSGWIDSDTVQQLQDLIVPMGEASGVFGSGRSLHYGPKTSIRHGTDICRRSNQPFDESNPRTAWVAGIASASTALTLLGWRLQQEDPTIWEKLVRSLGPRGASGILFNLLVEFEKACGECDAGEEKQNEASSLTTQADSLDADYASLILDLASTTTEQGSALAALAADDKAKADESKQEDGDSSSLVDDAEDSAEQKDDSDDDSSGAAAAGPGADATGEVSADDISFGNDDADTYESFDGLLATSARHLSLRARATDDDDTDPSLIHLDAQGGDGEDNGVVAINSSGQATIVCGPASLQMRRDSDTGQIDIHTGDEGTMSLTCGDSSTGSKIKFDPSTLTLQVGGDAGSQIEMTPDGIKLSFAGGMQPSIELNSSGITLKCGSSELAVTGTSQTTKAESISHEANVSLAAKGAMLDLEASASATLKGAITMIN